MDGEKSEKHLISLRERIAELLDNISDIGTAINKKSNNLLDEIGRTRHHDTTNLERIGLGMVKMLNTLNINIVDITNILENELEEVNKNRTEKIFKDLCSKMFEYKNSLCTVDTMSKNTQTDWDIDIPSDTPNSDRNLKEEHCKFETTTVTDINNGKVTDNINLSLLRSNTQDTEDNGWVDSINRSPTALTLWNIKYQGEKISITDEFLNRLKEEQNEDNEWDRKTEDLNYEFDKHLSSSDDTFIDGNSPKSEDGTCLRSDQENLNKNGEGDPDSGPSKESLIMKDKLADIQDTTPQSTHVLLEESNHGNSDTSSIDTEVQLNTDASISKTGITDYPECIDHITSELLNSEETLHSEQTKLNSEDSEMRKSKVESVLEMESNLSDESTQTNNDFVSDIPNCNKSIKQGPISEEAQGSAATEDDLDAQCPPIISKQNESKEVIPSNCASSIGLEDTQKNAEPIETNKSDICSLNSFDDNMSTTLIALAEHLENDTSIGLENKCQNQLSGSGDEQDCVNRPIEDANHNNSLENSGPDGEQVLDISQDGVNKPIEDANHNNSLDNSGPDGEQVLDISQDCVNKPIEDANHNNSLENSGPDGEQVLDISQPFVEVSRIQSEVTYSQETVKLDTDFDENVDNIKHISESNQTLDDDETDVDENTMSEPLQQILDNEHTDTDRNVDHKEHLSESSNKPHIDERNIDEDVNKLLPLQNVYDSENDNLSTTTKNLQSDESTLSNENVCKSPSVSENDNFFTATTDTSKNGNHIILEQNNTNLGDSENCIENMYNHGCDEANKVPISELPSLSEQSMVASPKNIATNDENNLNTIFEGTKSLPLSDNFLTPTEDVADIEKNTLVLSTPSFGNNENINEYNCDKANLDEETNTLPMSSETGSSQETIILNINENVDENNKYVSESSNMSDSDQTDINEDADKLCTSKAIQQNVNYSENLNLQNTKKLVGNEENIMTQGNTTFENDENLSTSPPLFQNEDLLNNDNEYFSNKLSCDDGIDTNEQAIEDINIPRYNNSVTTDDNENPTGKYPSSNEENSLSQNSSKSFVFNISENINHIEGELRNIKSDPLATTLKDEHLSNNVCKEKIGVSVVGPITKKDNTASSLDTNTKLEENKKCHHKGDDRPSLEILSDSDDGVHLDVTMEEIISTGSPVYLENTNDQDKKLTVQLIKQEELDEAVENAEQDNVVEENNTEQYSEETNTSQRIIGDELLELLREVKVPSVATLERESSSNKVKSDIKKEMMEADEIFKMLREESASDISDSDISDDNISLSCLDDSELFENKYIDEIIDSKDEEPPQHNIEILPEFNLKDCYISIPNLKLEAHDVVKVNKSLNDSIDRLCDINSILSKRKHGDQQEKSKMKKVKKSSGNKGTSDSESLSDYSDSDSDNALHDNSTFSTTFNAPLEQKLDDILANEICKILKNNSSNESTDVDSDGSNKSSNKAKNGDNGKAICNDIQKKKLSKEERRKKSWKNDPLLRGKLTSDDSSDSSTSDSDKSSKKRRALRTNRYEHDTDFNIISDESDSNSDPNIIKQNKSHLVDTVISPIKGNIPVEDSSTDPDSDVEIIILKQETPEKDPEVEDNESGPSSSQKGRRNIRALMSDESLTEATQRANKEEQERIERLEDRYRIKESLSQSQSFSQIIEEDTLVIDVDDITGEPLVSVHPKLTRRLKPHQKLGIQFMWDSCYESLERLKVDEGSGCILAHCMGLGKTFQVITLLHTLFTYEETNTNHVLVVCPLSTVNNWKKEVRIAFKHFPDNKFNIITIADKKEVSQKYDIVKKWRLRKKSVLVMGYEGFETVTNETKLDKIGPYLKQAMLEALIDPGPDLVICDEGHLLRNKKALKTLALNRIKTKRRIVLTGTPLQNNLLEYYYMVNFVKPNLLGNMKEYKTNFVNPITNGQYEDSTAIDIKLMMKRTHVLHKLLKKTIQRVEDTELKIYLPKIVDHAVFIQLHQVQVDLYEKFSQIVAKNSSNTNRKGFLSDFCTFQYICTHPHLLSIMENLRSTKIKERDLITNEQEDNPICNIEGWWKAVMPPDAAEKIDYGNKLMVLKAIIEECEEIGDKVLVFSQSLGELDLIELFLKKEGTAKCRSWQKSIDYSRMDGTVPPAHRSTICDSFNDKDKIKLRLLLMSTKVGGLGLNLTAANRVIIMTVNWNPSYDIQSVFRVYRFGQEKEVYVYRLVALDSMEEKVYQRTVTKLAIAHRVVDKHQITRHYKSMDLQELYSCKPSADIERPISNVPEDKVLAKLILKLPYIFKYHEHQALLENRPEDNLNEQELNAAWDEFKRIKDAPQAPPPQHQQQAGLSQIPNIGPTFSMAYNLTRPKVPVSHGQKREETLSSIGDELLQYFNPNSSENTTNNFKKRMQTTPNILKHVLSKPASGSARSLEDRGNSGMIPVYTAAKGATEQDPLYIPLSTEDNQISRSYSELLTNMSRKNSQVPKLLPDATMLLDRSSSRGGQKETLHHRKPPEKSQQSNGSIVILDDDSHKTANGDIVENNHMPLVTSKNTKRKRNNDNETQPILKKMKEVFNMPTSHQASISVDDDDEAVITDTTSESGSLSSELITNLGRSGITIHKVIKNSSQSNGKS